MFGISDLNEIQLLVFGLILLRMTAFVFTAALFNSVTIPSYLKVLLALSLTTIMTSLVLKNNATVVSISDQQDYIIVLAMKEMVLGIVLGFVTRLFFFVMNMASELISMSMGLGQAQLFNPLMGTMGNVMEQFFTVLSTILYFAINGHHFLIQALFKSFEYIAIDRISLNEVSFLAMTEHFNFFLQFGFKIAAPIVISMLIIQVGVGILSKAVHQINVMTTSVTITIILSFFILFLTLPYLVGNMNQLIAFSGEEMMKFLKKI